MTKRIVSAETENPAAIRLTRVGTLAAWISLGSFFYYLRRGEILMLGDTVAHINIARRVFDSLNPGLQQLGTVWLPLPHLLMIPFLLSNKMWQSGIGGSIPSMIAYVFGVIGIFRLAHGVLASDERTRALSEVGGFVAAFAYGANPNLLYVQATALTEPIYLAFFIWTITYFMDFTTALSKGAAGKQQARHALRRCAYCIACAELTRYDGWFLAGVIGALITGIAVLRRSDRDLRKGALKFLLGIGVAPLIWLAYNAAVYGNPLEFANGPYSSRAIEQRVAAPNPGAHNILVASSYFLKSAQITLAVGNWGRLWLLASVVATAILAWRLRRQSTALILLLLWSPAAFYALSIAYGSVVLHVPMWWPFAIFNQRFGLELLPLFAVSAGALVAIIAARWLAVQAWKIVAPAVALIVISYAFIWIAKPLCWEEAWRNWEMRRALDTAVERAIKQFPPDSRFLMDITEHIGIMERLGIPLRRVVNNEDHRPWVRPSDPNGIWEGALADPGHYVNYVIVFKGDLVDKNLNRTDLTLLEEIHALGQPAARIYQTRLPTNQLR